MHAKELKKTTNTGRLAVEALVNSEMCVRGKTSKALDLKDILDLNCTPLLLYPSDDSEELNSDFVLKQKKPLQLIVPDGNWRQASKVHYRHKELAHVRRVRLATVPVAEQYMRLETVENGMATLEAIAHALRVIEGDTVYAALIALYKHKLEQTLLGRGVSSVNNSNFKEFSLS